MQSASPNSDEAFEDPSRLLRSHLSTCISIAHAVMLQIRLGTTAAFKIQLARHKLLSITLKLSGPSVSP